ncbi:hypothetical protein KV100_13805 [Mumia sp. zg.B21]|uniref:hypothetical protein n=1 Tax=Mumia sp. zg.B21 TaxID=2855447 RepID=UPI001C6E74C8|nr:hypothetical protein [Mumia sp. zg.B21]MBW9210730.1 hypothetical protein [Mumia sp. zg.B21]
MTERRVMTDLLLPEGTRLVHIGPHKTGSTALQGAFDNAREAVLAQGVRYAGRTRHESVAVRWVTERVLPQQDSVAAEKRWRALVEEMTTSSEPRLVVSSEFFSDAKEQHVEAIARDLGRDKLTVAITLRPLAKILPSQWQQYLQRGLTQSYDEWLDKTFNGTSPTPSFWQRHRHDALVRRWGDVVGYDNVVVIMLDGSDYGFLPRTFEQLLGLRPDTLELLDDLQNRSLTFHEAEMLRAFNVQYKSEKLAMPLYDRLVNTRAGHYLKHRRPERDERKIETPAWGVEAAQRVGAEMADAIVASGARVIGDPATLALGARPRAEDLGPVQLDPELSARLAVGLVLAGQEVQDIEVRAARRTAARGVRPRSSRELIGAARRRLLPDWVSRRR